MHALIIFAHPDTDSLTAGLSRQVAIDLENKG